MTLLPLRGDRPVTAISTSSVRVYRISWPLGRGRRDSPAPAVSEVLAAAFT